MPRRLRYYLWLLASGVLLSAIAFANVVYFQEKMIFFPSTLKADHQFHFNPGYEEKYILLNGERIHSLLFKVPEAQGLILYFHGNAGNLNAWGYTAEKMAAELKWNVWIVDYPGYGKSEGQIRSEAQLFELAETMFEEAKKTESPDTNIVALGRSLGTGIAAYLASKHQLAGLVLETPYYNFPEIASEKAPWAPYPTFFLRYNFLINEWLPNIKSPILIVHGTEDEVIPYSHGKRLSEKSKNIQFVKIPRARHNDFDQYEEYWTGITTFFNKLGPP